MTAIYCDSNFIIERIFQSTSEPFCHALHVVASTELLCCQPVGPLRRRRRGEERVKMVMSELTHEGYILAGDRLGREGAWQC